MLISARLFALFTALCAALPAVAQPLPLTQVAPGIYMHQGAHEDIDDGYSGDICNIGFIVGRHSVAVIDTGGSPEIGARLREAIRAVTPLPVRYVINTHVHPDHVFGNTAFRADDPVFVGHHKLAGAMAQRSAAYLAGQQRWLGARGAGSELIPPGQPVEGTLTLDLGERTLRLTAYPTAHTSTDLTVFDDATGTLWTGDLLFIERTPSLDGDLHGWLRVIEELKRIPARQAIPGHGPVTADLAGALENQQRYLSVLLQDVRQAIKQGRSMAETMSSAAAGERARWQLFEPVNRRNVNLIFPALEWE